MSRVPLSKERTVRDTPSQTELDRQPPREGENYVLSPLSSGFAVPSELQPTLRSKGQPTMTDETRRRQKREELMAKADRIIKADRMKLFIESRRTTKGPYSPEKSRAQLRYLFGGKHRKATIGE